MYEFNPKAYFEENISKPSPLNTSESYLEKYNYYFFPDFTVTKYKDAALPSIYHQPYKIDLTQNNTL